MPTTGEGKQQNLLFSVESSKCSEENKEDHSSIKYKLLQYQYWQIHKNICNKPCAKPNRSYALLI